MLRAARPLWHGFLAYLGAVLYGFPSKQLIVIGVTGTAGKSSTVQMLAKILNDNKKKTGYVTTVELFDGRKHEANRHGMSMPGRFMLQRDLRQMLKNGCKYAILEATSEGLAQNRHLGINFDCALFTNLAPAHLDSHGGFENYKRAKAKLFTALKKSPKKDFLKNKIVGVNLDSEHAEYFGSLLQAEKFGITFSDKKFYGAVYAGTDLKEEGGMVSFVLQNVLFTLNFPGKFNAYNALLATGCANVFGVSINQCAHALKSFVEISGRMEEIKNSKGVRVFLDYAPEPIGMENSLLAVQALQPRRIIHVFGSTGGHRDVQKRFEFGAISAKYADIIFITNDDVYDSDPEQIARDVRSGIERCEEKHASEIIEILDRREAIAAALRMARSGDVVLITGKGSEGFLVLPGNKRIEWNEREVIEQSL